MSGSPVRVMLARPGPGGSDRGSRVLADALREAGVDVVDAGRHRRPEEVVDAAMQAQVDALGIIVLSGDDASGLAEILRLARQEAHPLTVFGGGLVPAGDLPDLERQGAARMFTPGAAPAEIVDWIVARVVSS